MTREQLINACAAALSITDVLVIEGFESEASKVQALVAFCTKQNNITQEEIDSFIPEVP